MSANVGTIKDEMCWDNVSWRTDGCWGEGMGLNNCPERKGESVTGRIYINLPRVLRKRNLD